MRKILLFLFLLYSAILLSQTQTQSTGGVASSAASSASVTITNDGTTNSEFNFVLSQGSSGSQPLKVDATQITYNPALERVSFNGTLNVQDTCLFGPNPPTEPEWDDYTWRGGKDINSWSGMDFQNRSAGTNARAIMSVHAGPIGYSGVNMVQYGEGHTQQHPGWGPGIVTNAGAISAEVLGSRLVISHSGNKPVQFATGDSIRMTVGPYGNKIGIGTMSPIATLHLSETFNRVLCGSTSFLSTEPYSFQRNDNSQNHFLLYNSIDGNQVSSRYSARALNTVVTLTSYATNFTTSGMEIANTGALFTTSTSDLSVGTQAVAKLRLWTNGSERMRIDDAGLVGIGTGTVALGFQFVTNLNTSATSSVQSSIQMKTTSSGTMADDFGGGILMAVRDVDGVDNNIAGMTALRKGADNSGMWAVRTASAGSLTYHLNIAANGNVAIGNGTTAGLSKLDVVGNLAVGSGFAGIAAAPTNGAIIQGLVGIGTSSPSSLFSVGSGSLFQVNTSGDMVKIKNVTYSWPSAQASSANASLVNDASGNLSWGAIVTSGTYTFTATDSANTSARTSYESQWMRVGNVVTVSGVIDVDPTLTATSTIIKIPLPITSNFTATSDCRGTAACGDIAAQSAAILCSTAYAAVDFALMKWVSSDVTNQPMSYTFTYEVK